MPPRRDYITTPQLIQTRERLQLLSSTWKSMDVDLPMAERRRVYYYAATACPQGSTDCDSQQPTGHGQHSSTPWCCHDTPMIKAHRERGIAVDNSRA